MDLLQRLDDWLIDHIFQPLTDKIRLLTGCSKRVPAAIGCFVSVGSLIPLLFFMAFIDDLPLRIVGSFGWLFCLGLSLRGTILILEELKNQETSAFLEAKRASDHFHRKMSFLSTCGVLLMAWPIFSLLQVPSIGIALSLGATASFCAIYFEACTDLPKPPKKKVALPKLSLQG